MLGEILSVLEEQEVSASYNLPAETFKHVVLCKMKVKLQAAPGPLAFQTAVNSYSPATWRRHPPQERERGREKKSGAEAGSDKTG